MYAIENALGRFEGETEKDAKKKLRAAQVAAQKAERLKQERQAVARDRAKITAFSFLNWFASGESAPSGWRYYEHGHKYAAHCEKSFTPVEREVISAVTPDTEYGRCTIEMWYADYQGSVQNGSGWDCLIFVKQNNGDVDCFAVGVHLSEYALERVNGITPAWFNRGKA